MPRRRKRTHRPDLFQRTFRAFYGRLTGMGWFVLAGGVSAGFILVGLVFLSSALEELEDTAWEKFEQARTPEEMEEIAREYTRYVGPHAYLTLGNMLFAESSEATEAKEKRAPMLRAREAFSKGAELFPKHFFAPYLLEGEALCLEELGENERAVGVLQRAYEADPKGHLAPKLQADIGRNLVLMGDEEGGRFYLEKAVYSGVRVGPGMEADWLLNARLLLARAKAKALADGAEKPRPLKAPGVRVGQPEETPAAEGKARPAKPEGEEAGARPAAAEGAEAPAAEEKASSEARPAAGAQE